MNDTHFKFSNTVIGLPLFFVFLLWLIFWIQIRFDLDFYEFGIYPRTFSGLKGILFSSFIHENLGHLYNNSLPLLVLLPALCYFYPKQTTRVLFFGIIISGLITWLIGRSNYHIGASGLIYVLVSFIFFKGIQTKYYRLVALSLTVILLYGGMIWYVFPDVDTSISWEGHLGGLVSGFVVSLFLKPDSFQKSLVYDWQKPDFKPEDDVFMRHFDENGNFVNTKIDEEEQSYFHTFDNVHYTITKKKD